MTVGVNACFHNVVFMDEKERLDYPPTAIRETLLNTIFHREYAFSDSTLIRELVNQGVLIGEGGGKYTCYRLRDQA